MILLVMSSGSGVQNRTFGFERDGLGLSLLFCVYTLCKGGELVACGVLSVVELPSLGLN